MYNGERDRCGQGDAVVGATRSVCSSPGAGVSDGIRGVDIRELLYRDNCIVSRTIENCGSETGATIRDPPPNLDPGSPTSEVQPDCVDKPWMLVTLTVAGLIDTVASKRSLFAGEISKSVVTLLLFAGPPSLTPATGLYVTGLWPSSVNGVQSSILSKS